MAVLRLDKLLAHRQGESRREVTNWIRAGCVLVNGETVRDGARKVTPGVDIVELDGKEIVYEQNRYFMLNKPVGVISATQDDQHETVLSLFRKQEKRGLFPVGRLDIDTRGLLFVTDDGAFSHRITSPKHHVEKEYIALVRGTLDEDACARFAAGLVTKHGDAFQPALLEVLERQDAEALTRVRVVLREGQYHQVKRMVKAVGGEVCALKRVKIGDVMLDERLSEGEYRALTAEEIKCFDGC